MFKDGFYNICECLLFYLKLFTLKKSNSINKIKSTKPYLFYFTGLPCLKVLEHYVKTYRFNIMHQTSSIGINYFEFSPCDWLKIKKLFIYNRFQVFKIRKKYDVIIV